MQYVLRITIKGDLKIKKSYVSEIPKYKYFGSSYRIIKHIHSLLVFTET